MFTRKRITVPSAGESEIYYLDGVSIIVENMPNYSGPVQVPTLSFGDSSNNPQPLYNQSTYVFGRGFDRVVITGTTESAGDEIFLLASDECLQEEINSDATASARATLKATFGIVTSDTVDSLTALQLTNDNGDLPSAMYISCRNNPVTYAFDEEPAQGISGLGHILQNDEDPVKIEGINFIEAFRFRAQTSGDTPTLTLTLEY